MTLHTVLMLVSLWLSGVSIGAAITNLILTRR
jgi:hypothetical protein